MKTTLFALAALLPLVAACSGTSGDPLARPAPAASAKPTPSAAENYGASLGFNARAVKATRTTADDPCDAASAYSAEDIFALQADGKSDPPVSLRSVVIAFGGRASAGDAQSLVVDAPDASGFQLAHTNEASGRHAATVSVVGAGAAGSARFDSATVTVLAFPERDGEPLTARVAIHFASGGTLDETFSATLAPSDGGCGGS